MINDPRDYDVQFKLTCYSAESPLFALLSCVPQIKEATFRFESISDEDWREKEHVLSSVGATLVHVQKTPHIPVEEPEEEEYEPDTKDIPKEKVAGVLFDEVLRRREAIYEEGEKGDSESAAREARDYNYTITALLDEIVNRVKEQLINDVE